MRFKSPGIFHMSYERYEQRICINNHYQMTDVYDFIKTCMKCGTGMFKVDFSVDETNGHEECSELIVHYDYETRKVYWVWAENQSDIEYTRQDLSFPISGRGWGFETCQD